MKKLDSFFSALIYNNTFLLFLCILLIFIHLYGLYPTIMEARNFVSTKEILDSGEWLHTTLNGEVRYEKPPLPTWFTAISGYFSINISNGIINVTR